MKQKAALSALAVRIFLILSVLALWEWGVRSSRLPDFYISYPSEIAVEACFRDSSGSFRRSVWRKYSWDCSGNSAGTVSIFGENF